jgi:hypothetical protein
MESRFARPIIAFSFLVVAGCSSTVAQQATGGNTSTSSSSGGTGATTTNASSSGSGAASSSSGAGGADAGNFDAGATVTTYTTGMGPITLAPGQEETNCITIHLNNAEGGYVRRFRADLTTGSHHMIVYQSTDTTESPTPTPCQALGGILQGQHPVFIAQNPTAELVFPTDENGVPVGFQIAANQMVHIEFHTINTTQATIMASGKAYMDVVPLSTTITLSDMAFWGTKNIAIPPLSSFQTPVDFQAAIPGTKSFALTTHQHHLGTDMKVWYGASASDTSDMVANGTSWANPPLVMLDPPLDFPAGGGKGLAFQCTWNNPGTTQVNFGESANDEMCFLWHYYYPSQGFQACLDGLCY